MALGTLTAIDQVVFPGGPQFIDLVSLVGDGAYPNTGGTIGSTGLQAALRVLRKDTREIVSVEQYKCNTAGQSVQFDPATGKLRAFLEDQTSGVVAEIANGVSLAAVTYTLKITSR